MHGSHICCNFADENKSKAGQLGVMEALLEALSLHKANAEVAASVAAAIRNICWHFGTDQSYSPFFLMGKSVTVSPLNININRGIRRCDFFSFPTLSSIVIASAAITLVC